MNATKRIAVTRHILNQFAKNKQHPPMKLAEMSGRQLRQLARHLGILRKRVTFTPLSPQSRAIVWAKAREEYTAWTLKTKPAR